MSPAEKARAIGQASKDPGEEAKAAQDYRGHLPTNHPAGDEDHGSQEEEEARELADSSSLVAHKEVYIA